MAAQHRRATSLSTAALVASWPPPHEPPLAPDLPRPLCLLLPQVEAACMGQFPLDVSRGLRACMQCRQRLVYRPCH